MPPKGKGKKRIADEYYDSIRRRAGARDSSTRTDESSGADGSGTQQPPGIGCAIPEEIHSNVVHGGGSVSGSRSTSVQSKNLEVEKCSQSQKVRGEATSLYLHNRVTLTKELLPLKWNYDSGKPYVDGEPGFDMTQITRFVGSHIRKAILMVGDTFRDLPHSERQKIWDLLGSVINMRDAPNELIEHLTDVCQGRYREYKSECHKIYQNTKRTLPPRFIGREHVWEWLCDHFESGQFKKKSDAGKEARVSDKKKKHRCGSKSMEKYANEFREQKDMAPHITTFLKVYEGFHDEETLKKLKGELASRTAEFQASQPPSTGGIEDMECHKELPVGSQAEAIGVTVGSGRGSYATGMGNSYKRKVKSRGGARLPTSGTSEERLQQEFEKKTQQLEEKFRVQLEEMKKQIMDMKKNSGDPSSSSE